MQTVELLLTFSMNYELQEAVFWNKKASSLYSKIIAVDYCKFIRNGRDKRFVLPPSIETFHLRAQ